MSDEVQTTDQIENAPAPAEVTPPAAVEPQEPLSTADNIQANADKVTKSRVKDDKTATPVAGKPGTVPAPAFEPSLKYKVMDKEHDIPPEFKSLMKDSDSEKKIREIFEKSTGLEVVKENLSSARNERDQARKQHSELNSNVQDLRNTYQSAVNSGDLHKLDAFWKKLDIPQDVILKYAYEKVKLHEMPQEQRQALEAKQQAEFQADDIRGQQARLAEGYMEQRQQMTQLMLERALSQPANVAAAADFEARVGKPGMFKEEIRRWGEADWFQRKVYTPPEQVIANIIKHYGLKTDGAPAPAAPAVATANRDPRQNVIVKTQQTIPNMGGGGSQSPLKSRPKNLDDLNALRERSARGEAV